MSEQPLEVIIVNYKTADLTIRCVKSIIDLNIASEDKIIVVDNCSADDSIEKVRQEVPSRVRTVCAARNDGFGAGVNFGFSQTKAPFALVLNPDTYFKFNSVKRVLDFMSAKPKVGIVGLDLVNPDGSRQYSARRFYSLLDICARRSRFLGSLLKSRVSRHLMQSDWLTESPFKADWVMGTGFIVRRKLYEAVQGMDEGYFLYMEDVDLCARSWQAGYEVICYPGAELVHDHQRSSASRPWSFAARTHIKSALRFAKRFKIPTVSTPRVEDLIQQN